MKPNVAGLLGAGAIVLLFAATGRKTRLLALTVGAIAICITVLVLNGVSVRSMLASYSAAAAGRGRFSAFGFEGYSWWDLLRAVVGVIALAAPVWVWMPAFAGAVRRSDLRAIARELLFVLAPPLLTYYRRCTCRFGGTSALRSRRSKNLNCWRPGNPITLRSSFS